jgi:hypothetical protein
MKHIAQNEKTLGNDKLSLKLIIKKLMPTAAL